MKRINKSVAAFLKMGPQSLFICEHGMKNRKECQLEEDKIVKNIFLRANILYCT
jgi:hypothetical protein